MGAELSQVLIGFVAHVLKKAPLFRIVHEQFRSREDFLMLADAYEQDDQPIVAEYLRTRLTHLTVTVARINCCCDQDSNPNWPRLDRFLVERPGGLLQGAWVILQNDLHHSRQVLENQMSERTNL